MFFLQLIHPDWATQQLIAHQWFIAGQDLCDISHRCRMFAQVVQAPAVQPCKHCASDESPEENFPAETIV